jgi:hypothetical protein
LIPSNKEPNVFPNPFFSQLRVASLAKVDPYNKPKALMDINPRWLVPISVDLLSLWTLEFEVRKQHNRPGGSNIIMEYLEERPCNPETPSFNLFQLGRWRELVGSSSLMTIERHSRRFGTFLGEDPESPVLSVGGISPNYWESE